MSFPTYPAYKSSGVDWLGDVPQGWSVVPLKHAVTMRSGEQITAEQIEEAGPFPVFGGNGLRGYTSAYTHDGHFALIGRQGALCGNVNYAVGRFWASEHAVVVSPKMPCAIRWIGELLRAMDLGRHSISAAQPGLSVEVIGNLRIPVPPLAEQSAIADFLERETGKIEALVAEQERLITLLEVKRQAIIAHAVTKGLDPKIPMKDSGVEWLGEVPEGWEVVRLGVLFREAVEEGEYDLPVLSVSIHDGVSDRELTDSELDRKVTRSENRAKYKKVAPGDLVYNMMRAWQGGFGSVSVPGMVSPAYVVARPRCGFRTEVIELLLRTSRAVEEMRRRSKGVTDFRLRLYWDDFKEIKIALPPPSEQEQILAAITKENARSSALAAEAERAISLLSEHRAAVISAAVTGKIDVRSLIPDTREAA